MCACAGGGGVAGGGGSGILLTKFSLLNSLTTYDFYTKRFEKYRVSSWLGFDRGEK